MNPNRCIGIAAFFLALAVIFGAMGAHALAAKLSNDDLSVYHTAVQYHFWHGLGMLAVGAIWLARPQWTGLTWVAWLLALGMVFFCGSLYLVALTGMRQLAIIAPPVGGAAFIAAWIALAVTVWRA